MVNSISMVGFRGENVDMLSRPGKFSNVPQQPKAETLTPQVEKKSVGTGKKVVGTLAGLVALASALIALPKAFPNAIKQLGKEQLETAKWTEKATHYLAVAGDTISKYTYDKIAKLFTKSDKVA